VETSALGENFEADPPKAIDALVVQHGSKKVAHLILEAHAALNDDASDEHDTAAEAAGLPPEKKPRVA